MSRSPTNGRDRHAPVSDSEMTRYREADAPSDGVDVEIAKAENPISHVPNQPLKSEAQEPENPYYI